MTLDTLLKLRGACVKRDLTMESYLTLRAFGENPGISITTASRLLGVTSAGMTFKVDALEKKGLGTRKAGAFRNEDGRLDRRKLVFVPSAKAEKILREIGGIV